MKKFNVFYAGGEARCIIENGALAAVDYMMVYIPDPEEVLTGSWALHCVI